MKSLTIKQLVKDLKLEVVYQPENQTSKITLTDINRPGLQLGGYYDFFVPARIQIIGNAEWHYLRTLPNEEKERRLAKFFKYPIPVLIVTRDLEVSDIAIKHARENGRTILRTSRATTKFLSKLSDYLNECLAPSTTLHGVLVDIFGIGTLIMGKSGVGKSETALDLIERGHRLVADDAVEIRRVDNNVLRGTAPEIIRHYMELRGIGIIDIKRLYGMGAISNTKEIELIVELEEWDSRKAYDRLGLDEEYMEVLGVKVTRLTIPVRPGRDLAMIIEVAAKNYRQKRMGYNAAKVLNEKLMMKTMQKSDD
ncbi:MAG: HPr(Ser) kinase/phosphatase [Tissierellales bacterium]|jgi:HPr kinase/phosphorylase|nr:HPr(Ser) kinase/phosphatase [Tissierellales bacterium]